MYSLQGVQATNQVSREKRERERERERERDRDRERVHYREGKMAV